VISRLTSPVLIILLGLLPGFGIWLLLALCTNPNYEFGVQKVRLASLDSRGLARLIDLAGIAVSIAIVGFIWMRDFDWLSLAEAANLKLDHPTIHRATHVLIGLVILLTAEILLLLVIQGNWGVTPGKWLCRLRTVGTNLRPCGFARSLAREVMLILETCTLTFWLIPMLSIAFSSHRQRLGDLVADTIVVDAKCSL
jgi:uncharacterized RDD family membrane protein YckC